jgi:hypothetical protein
VWQGVSRRLQRRGWPIPLIRRSGCPRLPEQVGWIAGVDQGRRTVFRVWHVQDSERPVGNMAASSLAASIPPGHGRVCFLRRKWARHKGWESRFSTTWLHCTATGGDERLPMFACKYALLQCLHWMLPSTVQSASGPTARLPLLPDQRITGAPMQLHRTGKPHHAAVRAVQLGGNDGLAGAGSCATHAVNMFARVDWQWRVAGGCRVSQDRQARKNAPAAATTQ